MKSSVLNQKIPLSGRNPKNGKKLTKPLGPGKLLRAEDYKSQITLTAQQFADKAARQHAAVAGELVANTIRDMSIITRGIGIKLFEEMPFLDFRDFKDAADAYGAAVSQMRKALGLSEDAGNAGQRTLVSVQCVGEVHVSGPEGSSAMKPLTQMPDLSKLLPPKQ